MSDIPAVTPAITPAVQTRLLLPSRGGRTNVPLFLGLAILVVIAAAAIAAPLLTSWNPIEPDPVNALLAPSGTHLLGTDNLGRDVFARILYGARSDLTIASVAVAAPFLIGLTLGIVCGYVGGWLDTVAMRVADIVTAFPFFILVISLVFVLGGGVWTIFVAITAVSWVAYARIVRAETMVLRNTEFVAACRAGGISLPRILVRHIAPNVVTQAIVFAMSDIVMNVGVIVTLSYLGLGIVPPTPDWGAMMADGQQFLAAGNFGLTLFPAAAVVLTSLALSLVGEGLAHVLRIER
jgi:peptide/nickel transport system permease protein